MGLTEADTCRRFVVPRLPHSIAGQRTFTDGRIFVVGSRTGRRKQKRADYVLRYTRDIALAVVEAEAGYSGCRRRRRPNWMRCCRPSSTERSKESYRRGFATSFQFPVCSSQGQN